MSLPTLRRDSGARNLLVLLPGAYMSGQDIVDAGFFDQIEARRIDLDVTVVDVDLAAITGGSALPAVARQVLEPARRQGRNQVWLGGISLGGLLALCQVAQAPRSADGLCLIAPYPGSRLTLNAIASGGGLKHWQPTAEQLLDPEFRAWRWLKQPPPDLPVFVGHGSEDRFAAGMQQLAECFAPSARCIVGGGHDWPAWRQLWLHFLERGHFSVRK